MNQLEVVPQEARSSDEVLGPGIFFTGAAPQQFLGTISARACIERASSFPSLKIA